MSDTYIDQCWSCGRKLIVPHDRQYRHPETAGENTVDKDKRLCTKCWDKIGRRNLVALNIQW